MTDPFAQLIPDARAFLSELASNNSRDWFKAHKTRFESELKNPAGLFLDQITHDIGRRSGQNLQSKLFRPHRDVRFSKDKTPYHTHLHMLWAIGGPAHQSPALFLGVSPDYVRLGGGFMEFDKPALTRWRQAVDGVFGEEMQTVLSGLASQGYAPGAPELKRVAAPFDKDHPQADLLRRKGLTVWRGLPPSQFATPQMAVSDMFDTLHPFLGMLRKVL